MTENVVIKGGSRILKSARVTDYGVLELHATITDNALVKDHAVVARSVISDDAIIGGTAKVKDALVGGSTVLDVEYVGKNGHVFDNAHLVYIKIKGVGYTIHRTHSEAKGYSAQMMREDGTKVTAKLLKELIDADVAHRALQFLFNNSKKHFTE